jgi:hypothetical protein
VPESPIRGHAADAKSLGSLRRGDYRGVPNLRRPWLWDVFDDSVEDDRARVVIVHRGFQHGSPGVGGSIRRRPPLWSPDPPA